MSFESAIVNLLPAIYWKLDETSGTTAIDYSGNGQDGAYVGAYTLADKALVWGENRCVTINPALASTGAVQADPVSFNAGSPTQDWTFGFWVGYMSSNTNLYTFCYSDATYANALSFHWNGSSSMRVTINNTQYTFSLGPRTSSMSVSYDGTPMFVVITYEYATGYLKLYVNGNLLETYAATASLTISDGGALSVGQDQDSHPFGGYSSGDAFQGAIGHFFFAPLLMSSSSIASAWFEGAPRIQYIGEAVPPADTAAPTVTWVTDYLTPIASTDEVEARIVDAWLGYPMSMTIWATYATHSELVFRDGALLEPYTGQCSLSGGSPTVGGPTLLVSRTGGWPLDFTLTISATDTSGNTTTVTSGQFELSDDLEYPPHMNPFLAD